MEYNGHYITPHIDGDVYLKKPPLYNWILLGFFKTFQSHEEWVVRLPSLLSILLFAYIIGLIALRKTDNLQIAVITGLAWVTGGHLLFYSSYLGHIDVTYSLVTFLNIYAFYYYGKREEWLRLFAITYFLAAAGFLMKGLPSILFQGISLFAYFVFFDKFKRLFNWRHFVGILVFLLPVSIYLYFFSKYADLSSFVSTLWSESSSRTVGNKSFLESIQHLISFPLQFAIDLFPWSLCSLVLVKKEIRNRIWSDEFYRFCLLLFGLNILVYWLSPDYRARYVFMLMPLLLFPTIHESYNYLKNQKFDIATSAILIITIVGPIIYLIFSGLEGSIVIVVVLSITIALIAFRAIQQRKSWLSIILLLLTLRFFNSVIVLPERVKNSPYQLEKLQAAEIAEITKGEELAMYHSNVNLTMSWYLSLYRKDIPYTERYTFDKSSFYLVPQDVLSDEENNITYYTFVRRYLNKPFALVKFKKYFPEMPKEE